MQVCDQTTPLDFESRDVIIHFEEGLIGFSGCKNFVLKETGCLAPFRLLQSLESPELAFLVLEPSRLSRSYSNMVPAREWESLGVTGRIKPRVFVIVVIGSTPESSTGNFQAPLLINDEKMTGKQVILTDSGFSVRQRLL
jgi:flagellar assembly factor FliW